MTLDALMILKQRAKSSRTARRKWNLDNVSALVRALVNVAGCMRSTNIDDIANAVEESEPATTVASATNLRLDAVDCSPRRTRISGGPVIVGQDGQFNGVFKSFEMRMVHGPLQLTPPERKGSAISGVESRVLVRVV